MVAFTTPWMLAGLVLVAVPIAAHLLARRRRRTVVFPSVSLVREAASARPRLRWVGEWGVLAVRCLLVAVLVAAFARPRWVPASRGGTTENGRKASAVALVVDLSASMRQHGGGARALGRAKARACRRIRALTDRGKAVDIVFATPTPRRAFGKWVRDAAAACRAVKSRSATFGRVDLAAALVSAIEPTDGRRPAHVLVFTDAQRSTLRPALEWAADRRRPPIDLVRVGEPSANVGLSSPRASPARPAVGRTTRLSVTVTNHASKSRTVEVIATVDDTPLARRKVSVDPSQSVTVRFQTRVETAGEHRVVFSTRGDAFSPDNRCYLVFRAVEAVAVAVVTDEPPDDPSTARYFLLRALSPSEGEAGPAGRLSVEVMAGDALTAKALRTASVVLVDQVGRLPSSSLAAVAAALRRGTGVAFFSSPSLRENLDRLAGRFDGRVLPWRPARRLTSPPSDGWRVTDGEWSADLLSWMDPSARRALRDIAFRRRWAASTERRPGGRALLRFEDGTPALGRQRAEEATLVVANFSGHPSASGLPKSALYVGLVHGLVVELSERRGGTRPLVAGRSGSVRLDATARTVYAVGPDGRPTASRLVDDPPKVVLRRPARPGFYEIRSGDRLLRRVAVNVDPKESDLRRVAPVHVREALGKKTAAAERRPTRRSRAAPIALWPWCLVTALLLIAAELAAARVSR